MTIVRCKSDRFQIYNLLFCLLHFHNFAAVKLAKLNGKPEIFYSIQGEGKSIGKPAIFIRTSLCNLHCVWCDTDYTWNWEKTSFEHINDIKEGYSKYKKEEWIAEIEVVGILNEINKFPCKRIILTGGEPLMQQKELVVLAKLLHEEGYFIEVETNGTLTPTDDFDALVNQYNVSPKLSNSKNSQQLREKKSVFEFFSSSDKATFKFVIDTPKDLSEVKELITKYVISPADVYLMPQGTTAKILNEKQKWLVDICKEQGYNYTDRLHIHIYGDKRGV